MLVPVSSVIARMFFAGADQRADLLRIDLDHFQPRRAAADLRTRRRDARFDHVEDLQPGNPVALHPFAQQVDRNAGQLEVELESGDSVAGAADLEVHVAKVVLGADDVGEQQPLAVLTGHQTAADAGHRRGDRNARIHQRKRGAADRRHRGRAIRAHDLGDAAHDVGEVLGNHLADRTLGEVAVSDFAAARPGDPAHFADAEVRKVVVQIEALLGDAGLAGEIVVLLRVFFVAEGGEHQRLGFTAREERAAVNHRQDTDLRRKRTDFGNRTAVRPELLGENHIAGYGADEVIEPLGSLQRELIVVHIGEVGAQRLAGVVAQRIHRIHTVLFARDGADPFDAVGAEGFERLFERFRNRVELVLLLRAARLLRQLDLRFALFADRHVGGVHRLLHLLFADELGFTFDHDDLAGTAGVDELQFTLFHLGTGRIDDVLAVDETDADRADRPLERQVGEH